MAQIAPERVIWHQNSQKMSRRPPPARLHAMRGGASSPVDETWVSATIPPNQNSPLHRDRAMARHTHTHRVARRLVPCRLRRLHICCRCYAYTHAHRQQRTIRACFALFACFQILHKIWKFCTKSGHLILRKIINKPILKILVVMHLPCRCGPFGRQGSRLNPCNYVTD